MNDGILKGLIAGCCVGGTMPRNPALDEMLDALGAPTSLNLVAANPSGQMYAVAEARLPAYSSPQQVSEASRQLMEELARSVLEAMSGNHVEKVVDQMSFQRLLRVHIPLTVPVAGKVDVSLVRAMVESAYLLGRDDGMSKATEFAGRVAYAAEQMKEPSAAG